MLLYYFVTGFFITLFEKHFVNGTIIFSFNCYDLKVTITFQIRNLKNIKVMWFLKYFV